MKKYIKPEIQVAVINVMESYLLDVSGGEYNGRYDAKDESDLTEEKLFGW